MRCLRCGVPLTYYANMEHARRPSCDGGYHEFVFWYNFWYVCRQLDRCK